MTTRSSLDLSAAYEGAGRRAAWLRIEEAGAGANGGAVNADAPGSENDPVADGKPGSPEPCPRTLQFSLRVDSRENFTFPQNKIDLGSHEVDRRQLADCLAKLQKEVDELAVLAASDPSRFADRLSTVLVTQGSRLTKCLVGEAAAGELVQELVAAYPIEAEDEAIVLVLDTPFRWIPWELLCFKVPEQGWQFLTDLAVVVREGLPRRPMGLPRSRSLPPRSRPVMGGAGWPCIGGDPGHCADPEACRSRWSGVGKIDDLESSKITDIVDGLGSPGLSQLIAHAPNPGVIGLNCKSLDNYDEDNIDAFPLGSERTTLVIHSCRVASLEDGSEGDPLAYKLQRRGPGAVFAPHTVIPKVLGCQLARTIHSMVARGECATWVDVVRTLRTMSESDVGSALIWRCYGFIGDCCIEL